MTRPKLLTVLVLMLVGCHRRAIDSPEFRQAFNLYNQLYSATLDDSYGDPRMQQVVDLLGRVDPSSAEASEAKDLLAKVSAGMTEAKARADRLAADQKAASEPPHFVGSTAPQAVAPKKDQPAAAAAGPSLGMSRDEFTSKFGDCFERKGDYEQGTTKGEAFGLIATCNKRFASLTDSIVVLVDNKVVSLVPMKAVNVRTVDAGPSAAPPAPAPGATPAAAPAPAPAETVHYLPGAPHPEAPAAPPTP